MPPELALHCGDGPAVVLDLHPRTPEAQSLIDRLPQRGTILHSRRSGCELFLALAPQLPVDREAPELQGTLAPGDVVAHSCPPHYRDAPPADVVDSSHGYTHIGIVYDHGARFATPAGFVDVAVIGRVTSSMSELRSLGESIRITGGRPFSLVKRPEEP
jgi:hypothetical protein